ncbi:hypothetical protein AVO42_11630 [Thiomicrospira sp. XS5]|uniref:CHASE2 domain-containing protein n=1 Tax=Thiomicrospira sp. XS5 TaxID=1775636 RepID=UPI00074A2DC7|nr:adenylate/guanylate cyclase domain-containing protein [Thiomicrospira sp. XS5]KUJ75917.1 hypothetical protein AVO42_11630 [Thiomicrospira sp. XS5]
MAKRILAHPKSIRGLIALVAFLAVIILAYVPSALQKSDWMLGDFFTQQLSGPMAVQDIVIVDIDDNSLKTFGDWPWSRERLAQLIEILFTRYHPKALALDMVLPEPKDTEGDRALAQLLKTYPICLAVAFDFEQNPQVREIGHLVLGQTAHPAQQSATGYIANHAKLTEAAQCLGHITPYVDADGMIRRLPTLVRWNGQAWPNLGLALWQLTHPHQIPSASLSTEKKIPYRIGYQYWPSVTAEAILMGDVPTDYLQDKYLFIGSSALGLSDRVSTPIHPWLPGVVIHAETLYNLLHPIKSALEDFKIVSWLFSLMSILILIYLFSRFHPAYGLAAAALLMVVWSFLAIWGWQNQLMFSPSLPLAAILLVLIMQVPYEWMVVQRQNKKITRLFHGYVSSEVVDRLLASDEDPLNPQERELTVMFADIEGFTQLGKTLPTKQFSGLARQILTLITDAIYHHQGTLDKYIGDAAMAFWNAPVTQPDHAQKALECALDIQAKLADYNAEHPEQPIYVRIGIHTGPAMVGDLGTRFRNTYTAIGDTVNKAHRLHDLTKEYQTMILLSEQTGQQLKGLYNNGGLFKIVDINKLRH